MQTLKSPDQDRVKEKGKEGVHQDLLSSKDLKVKDILQARIPEKGSHQENQKNHEVKENKTIVKSFLLSSSSLS